jgi:uncharacterized membrane protein YgcG
MNYLIPIASFAAGVLLTLFLSRILRPLTSFINFVEYNCATKTITFTGITGEPATRRIWAKVVAGTSTSIPGFPAPYNGDAEIGHADVSGTSASIAQPAGANWPGSGTYTIIYWEDYGETGTTQGGTCSGGSGSGGGGGSSSGGGGGSSSGGGGGGG